MRIAVTGAGGQLGSELMQLLKDDDLCLWKHSELDIANQRDVQTAFTREKPNLVFNCAAYNQVDLAEDHPAEAFRVNALGPRNLAIQAELLQIPLVHISTNYVFGMQGLQETPYTESDTPGPQGAYAISKLAGEQFVLNCCSRAFVVRTTGLYGWAGQISNSNFVENMLQLSKKRQMLRIVDDQISAPTSTRELAKAIVQLSNTSAYGLYHATCRGQTSWFEFAKEIFRLAGQEIDIKPVSTSEYAAQAPRPLYSVLNCEKLQHVSGFIFPTWQQALETYMQKT